MGLKSCTAVHIDTGNDRATWNIDGELYVSRTVDVQVLPAAYNFFGRGIEIGGACVRKPHFAPTPIPAPLPPVEEAEEVDLDETPRSTASMVDQECDTSDLYSLCDGAASPIPILPTTTRSTSPPPPPKTLTRATSPLPVSSQDACIQTKAETAMRGTQTQGPTTHSVAVQVSPPVKIFSVPTQKCYSRSCLRSNGEFACYVSTCPHRSAYPIRPTTPRSEGLAETPEPSVVDEDDEGPEPRQSAEDAWARRFPHVLDPFEVVERFINSRHFRLVDFFQTLSRRRTTITVDDLRTRFVEMGLNLQQIQIEELIMRLDLNSDNIVTYRDFANCRRRYTLRMKSVDPAWQKFRVVKDDVYHKDAFLVTPSPRHVYPPI